MYDDLLKRAQDAGYNHGQAAGSWVIDGNTSEDTARAILKGLDEGDPAVYDALPSSPLSGEWADAPTPQSVFKDLGMTGDEDFASDVLDAYEFGFEHGAQDEVIRAASYLVSE